MIDSVFARRSTRQDVRPATRERWQRDCLVTPEALRSLAWRPDDLTLPPDDAEDSQVTRVLVHTTRRPDADPRYIYISVRGEAQKRRPTLARYDPVTLDDILRGGTLAATVAEGHCGSRQEAALSRNVVAALLCVKPARVSARRGP